MPKQLISSGSEYEAKFGYSRAVVEGDWVFVSGTTGFNYATGEISDDPAEQARQTLKTIDAALSEAGATMADVVRARYYVPNVDDWGAISEVLGDVFGDIRPAATAVIADLIDPRMKVEIEVTAKKTGNA